MSLFTGWVVCDSLCSGTCFERHPRKYCGNRPVADPGFPAEGTNSRGRSATILFGNKLPKTSWKWKRLDLRRARSQRYTTFQVPHPHHPPPHTHLPLDLPLPGASRQFAATFRGIIRLTVPHTMSLDIGVVQCRLHCTSVHCISRTSHPGALPENWFIGTSFSTHSPTPSPTNIALQLYLECLYWLWSFAVISVNFSMSLKPVYTKRQWLIWIVCINFATYLIN